MSQTIYLDNAATTPLSEQVLEEMMPYLKDSYGNPSSVYDLGVANKSALLTARKRIAKTLNCANPQNIYFTSGGTESDNWAIIGTAEQCKKNGNHIITSKIEHHAVLNTCAYLEEKGFEITYLDVDEQGFIKPEKLLQALRKDTILVSIMTANNEIGTIQPVAQIGAFARRHRILFHTDAVQAYTNMDIDVNAMQIAQYQCTQIKRTEGDWIFIYPRGLCKDTVYPRRRTGAWDALRHGKYGRDYRFCKGGADCHGK